MSKFMRESSPGSRSRPGGPPEEESIRGARAAILLLRLVLRRARAAELLALGFEALDIRRARLKVDVALQCRDRHGVLPGQLGSPRDIELQVRTIVGRCVLRGSL